MCSTSATTIKTCLKECLNQIEKRFVILGRIKKDFAGQSLFDYLSLLVKNTASVPGPEWHPIT